jgi:hypothetical protein
MPVSGGPYLVAACFCDKVLREADGVLSLIRVVDRWNIVGTTPTMSPTVVQGTLVVLFKSGIARSSAQLIITPISPTNERMQPPIVAPLLFEGDDDRGAGIVIPMGFPVREPGPYWFEVALTLQGGQAEVLTFIPMRIVYLQTGPMMPPLPNAGPIQGMQG